MSTAGRDSISEVIIEGEERIIWGAGHYIEQDKVQVTPMSDSII